MRAPRTSRFGAAPVGLALLVVGLAAAPAPAVAAPECQGRPVTIAATGDAEKLQGTEGADVISTAGFRNVEVDGRGGDDVICASAGRLAVLDGGAGDDTLVDLGSGAAGETAGATVLRGGPGADRYAGVAGTVLSYEGRPSGVRIDLSAGRVVDGAETDTVSGIHVVWGTLQPDTFVGSSGADTYQSSADGDWDFRNDRDTVDSGAGDDVVSIVGGTVRAGAGDDRVGVLGGSAFGGAGDDRLTVLDGGRADGGAGDDRLEGNALDDRGYTVRDIRPRFRLLGGPGDDVIGTPTYDGAGSNPCPSECARSLLRGGPGTDTLTLNGMRRAVVDLAARRGRVAGGLMRIGSVEDVRGSQRRDVIRGDRGRNRFSGRGGADILVGRGGRDVLDGGPGRDRADGGPGRDRCAVERWTSC